MDIEQGLLRLVSRFPTLGSDEGVKHILSKQATLNECLGVVERLLVQPKYCLAVGSSFRPCLLRLVSALCETHLEAGAELTGSPALSIALVRLLELQPQLSRIVLRYFLHAPSPHHCVGAKDNGVDDMGLVSATLLALQLIPELKLQWELSSFFHFLTHEDSAVRWVSIQVQGLQLCLTDHLKSRLASQHLTPEQLVSSTLEWEAQRNEAALELASVWMYCPNSCQHCSAGDDFTPALDSKGGLPPPVPQTPEVQQTPSKGKKGKKGKKQKADQEIVAEVATPRPTTINSLPPAYGFVEVCGVELPSRCGTTKSVEVPPVSQLDGPSHTLHSFVCTPTIKKNMASAALALAGGRPLLLEGPPGSGKTRLVGELARLTGNNGGDNSDEVGMICIHLDDQMDAKSLLGAYVCTAVPGEFAWQPGPLTQAVVEGRWVLIEDINMAPPDVLAALVPLLESRTLTLPSRGEVHTAAPGFQLLATVTSAPSGSSGAYGLTQMVKDILGGLWAYVRLECPTEVEQLLMLSAAHPALLPLLPTAVETLCLTQLAGGHAHGIGNLGSNGSWYTRSASALASASIKSGEMGLHLHRHFSVRDLFKWANRMSSLHSSKLANRGALNTMGVAVKAWLDTAAAAAEEPAKGAAPADKAGDTAMSDVGGPGGGDESVIFDLSPLPPALRQAAFVEAADCFVALLPNVEARCKLLFALAVLWHLPDPQAQVERVEILHKPSLVNEPHSDEISVGRVVLPKEDSRSLASASGTGKRAGGGGGGGSTFANTSHAMRIMERVSASLAQDEPILLVGETGTGKTTTLSHVANLVGAQLVAFNMSQQTDSSDLLGGFKPVDARDALLPLVEPFMALMRKTWTKGNNEDFLARVTKYAERKKWAQLLQAFKTAMTKVQAVLPDTQPSADSAARNTAGAVEGDMDTDQKQPMKKRKMELSDQVMHEWRHFEHELATAERATTVAKGGFAFAFVEGKLIQALRNGWWLLLDEINLAPSEVLERIAGILDRSGAGSITLVERGDTQQVPRHPNFRLVAAMNPATDSGKRELPAAMRNRFTELWVAEPTRREDLCTLVHGFLAGVGPSAPVDAVVDFYIAAKADAEVRLSDGAGYKPCYTLRSLCRSLEFVRSNTPCCGLQRALYDGFAMTFLTCLNPESVPIMEGLISKHLLPGIKNVKTLVRTPPQPPSTGESQHVLFEHFWLELGPVALPEGGRDVDSGGRQFIQTASVRQHLGNIARAVLTRKHPVLLQGPTSSGKTSMVSYVAAQTGHSLVRINNHEHTDLQEYLGSYVSDSNGCLKFQEGALVTAARTGQWVVLDELNLAPTEVLEALNRLLDDNRELFVPELNEVVRPHPHFMLFATQNPPGVYAGRKVLSRAFRSRFLELHVDECPDTELAEILQKRCAIAPSYAAKLISVMRELQRRRQNSNAFAGKHGFITPRDLFRWAERGAVGYQELAENGAMILGERLRSAEERQLVVDVLQTVMNVQINMEDVYRREGDAPVNKLSAALASDAAPGSDQSDSADLEAMKGALRGVVWTRSMRRLYTLVDRCLQHKEPVLLVGETGTGKTTVCQLLALMRAQHLHILNCNQHTEASDFLGGFRPSRNRAVAMASFTAAAIAVASNPLYGSLNAQRPVVPEGEISLPMVSPLLDTLTSSVAEVSKLLKEKTAAVKPAKAASLASHMEKLAEALHQAVESATAARAPFMWADGPLVTSMRTGDMILVDEINLAEDAVLERLNSVLEPGRTLTLAEKGGEGAELIKAEEGFRLLATMNPGGDFGKKELSPALTNRFTVIWVPALEDEAELSAILEARLAASSMRSTIAGMLLDFWRFFSNNVAQAARSPLSVRDLLAWVSFINTTSPQLGDVAAYIHGVHLTLLDGIGLGVGLPPSTTSALRLQCQTYLSSQLPADQALHGDLAAGKLEAAEQLQEQGLMKALPAGTWGLPPFSVPLAGSASGDAGSDFELGAPTTARNAFRVLRALQVRKAVLLEGSPGVGKTTLIAALAKCVGVQLVRINLSEATDMMDLLGADLPSPGGAPGQFTWCDGPLLSALRAGHWVLLDELNLAGQAILEGLNAVLDHRAEVFIPELGEVYRCHPNFRLFAAQNPLQEGGGRKGLPRSFLNRFTRVYVELLTCKDMLNIATALHPRIPAPVLRRMVSMLEDMDHASNKARTFAQLGGPWEFNLRDLLRWCQLSERAVHPSSAATPSEDPAALLPAGANIPQGSLLEGASVGADNKHDSLLEAAVCHFAQMLFDQRLRTAHDRNIFNGMLAKTWADSSLGTSALGSLGNAADGTAVQPHPTLALSPETLVVGQARLPRLTRASSDMHAAMGLVGQVSNLQLVPWQQPILESATQAVSLGWMLLMVGGSGSGKTSCVRLLSALSGRPLLEIPLTPGTDTSDLLGSFEQLEPGRKLRETADATTSCVASLQQLFILASTAAHPTGGHSALAKLQSGMKALKDHLKCMREPGVTPSVADHRVAVGLLTAVVTGCVQAADSADVQDLGIRSKLSTLSSDLTALGVEFEEEATHATAGRFEWVDGPLTRAVEHGGWVLLDNANLVNPTVLDRLNPLLEPHGQLYLPECGTINGQPRVVTPHSDFQLFLTMDPKHGEVSRAMRNRGIELFMLPPAPTRPAVSSSAALRSPSDQDVPSLAVLPASHTSATVPLPGVGGTEEDGLRLILESARVCGLPVLNAMCAAHHDAVALAKRAHRRGPSASELYSWAQLTRSLLEKGWGLSRALSASWDQVYTGAQSLSAAETLRMERVLHDAVAPMGMTLPSSTPPEAGQPGDAEDLVVSMDVDADDAAEEAELPAREAPASAMDEDAPLTEGWEVESYSKALLDSVPGTASSFIFPASWPNRIDVGVLAGSSVLSSVRRDFSILDYFLAACVGAPFSEDGTAFGAVDLQVLRDAPPSVLCMLPRSVLAPLLHGAAAAVGREVKGTELHNPIALQQLAWAAVNVMVQRACVMDAELRRLYVTRLAEKIKAAQALLFPSSESSTGQLALMISQLVHRQLDHPLTTSLNTATETALSCTGMPASLLSLLPLDHTYNQLAKPFLSCTSGDAWKLAAHLASRWKALQTHLAHYELVSQVQRAAPLAVAAGCATYLEASFWRSGRPDERAESEAQHPCIDWLHAVFSTVAEVEHMALVSVDLEWTSALAVTIGSVQHWREGLWRVVHGPLHTWAPASAASSETEVDHDRLVWTWQKMDKQLSRLATSLEGSVTSPSAKDSVLLAASRLLHIREGMCKVLDLLLIPPKPLLWRHGGKPLLPQSRSLILGQIQLQALAALLAVGPEGFQVDPMGAPMALAAMGVRLPQLEMHGVGHESSSADMLQRQRVSQVVVASLCSDVQFKQKVASGLSLLMFIPAMTLAAASDPATNSKALAVTAASAAAANSKAISVSGVHLPEGPKQGAPAAPALAMNRTQRREQEKQGGEIVSALLSELNKRALVAADECQGSAEALCEAAWLLKVSSSLALSAKSQPGADSGGSQEVSTMPAYMMISPVCQRLQLQLISLFDLSSLRTQRELLAGSILITANLALAQSTSGQPGSSGPQDSLATSELLALARQQWATFQAGGGRSPSDGVPYQQLVWVLEELAFAQGESNSPRGANKPNHLSEVVLPSVLNEMWLRWHQAMWSGARSCTPSAASAMAAIAPAGMQDTTLSACPSRLYLASYSAAMAALVREGCSAIQNKTVRLHQLKLAIQKVQNMASTAAEGWTGTAAVLPSNLCAAAKPSDVTFIWQALTGLYVQALLAHISSLPETMPQDVPVFKWQKRKSQISKGGSPRQSLVEMMESLLQCVDQTKSIDFNSAPKRQLWLANLGALLSLSTHPTLLLILEQVVLPCADALLHQADQGIQVPLVAAALPLHGRVWLLLGLLRLHLVLPPAGVDPAGKYSLKAQQLLLHISEGIDPEITVRQALQQLPGGPDESTHLVHLHEQRGSASTKLQAAVARIVPRPVPSQYKTLAAEVKSFVASFASLPRIQSLLGDLSRTPATQSAGYEAAVWQANAGSWLERLVKQYPMYLDIIQPVQLAVEEMRHGMSLLKAAVAVRSPAQQEQLALTSCIASGLMSFPLALPQPQTPESTQTASTKHKKALSTSASPTLCISGAPLPTSHLAEAGPHTVLFQLAGEAARAAAPQHLTSTQLDRIAELASYTTSLHAARAALLAACREILVAGTTGTPNTTSLERLFAFFFNSWKKLREFEEARAEEEAEQFKSKAVTSTFKTDEEEAEEDFKKSHPDHFILFKDISGPLEGEATNIITDDGGAADAAANAEALIKAAEDAEEPTAATELEARSTAARQLLDGDILEDIVRVHTAVYQSLQLVGAVRPDSSTLLGPAAVDKIFSISYDLGADLLGVLGGLDASVDSNTLVGHLYRCSSEYTHLARATESTAAEVVAAASGIAIGSKRSRKRGKDAASDKFTAIDVQVSCVEEVSLLQAPVTAVEIRLRELLEEFPTHPLLEQLLAICTRCLELPLTTPLKTALTGLELLLARAQLWETTAAKYVAITAQLRDVAALAMRWRSLELASWRATLKHVSQRHASGAAKNWFHLFQLLILGMPEPEAATEPAEERRNKSKRKRRSETKAELDPVTKQYRSTAATLEAFLQTSTLGEFEARLQLLRSFMCHVKLRLAEAEAAQESSSSPDTALVAAGAFGIDHPGSRKYLPLVVGALANTVAYYAQFSGAVRSALESGLSPIEKDLDDFVRLAKWEDRGYYAMKASTEKAQRYLHRLKRRAEEVLAQAAASVLATSVKAMGVAELMAAKPPPPPVTVAPKEAGATDKLDAAVEKESAKKAKVTPKKVTPKPPADAASTLPAASGLEMSEVDGSALLRDDLCLGAANIQTWSKLCSAAVAEAIAAQPAGSSATTPQASAQLPYHRRVPQLTKQLSKVLNSVVAAAGVAGGVAVTGVAGVEGDAADQESEGYPAAMYVDELAVGAASRAAELKDDIAKGARLRKKKALSDYTKALMAMGVSKRASDVPADDREVASWFSKAPANLDPLLKLLPGSKHSLSKLPAVNEEALAGASRSRTRADVYYYRSVARVQKLWSASKQPHTDLSPPEVAALQRLSEHLLFMCRRQRSMLSDVVDSHAAITQLCNWLSTLTSGHSDNRLQGEQQLVEVGIGRSDADPTSDSSSPPSLPPPQALACTWMGRLKQVLDRLASVLPDTVQLLAVLLEVNTEASQRSHLQQAAAVVDVWNSSVEGWKQDLETNMADTGLTIHKRENALSCCWVSDHSWSHLVSTFSAIDDLYTSLDTLMQASKNDGSESTQWPSSVPGLEPLMAEVTAAAAEAQAFAQATRPSSLGALGVSLASDACGQASGAAGKTSAGQAGAAEGADSVVPEGFTSHVEAAIQGVLLWAQSALSVTEKKAPGAPGAAAQGQLKKEEEEAEEEEEEECNIPQCVDSLLAHTQVARVGKVAAATSSVLLQLAEARDSLFSESSASDLQPSQERVQQVQLMTQQARSLYPMLCLLGGVLQQLSLRAIALHKSTAKLAYITSSIFATLVEEGYCVPEGEGEGKDGGDGNGEFKECEGTGMGDGEGKKDVSDKIEDEDQLRGAQQKGKEPKEKEENGPEEGPEGEEKGVEMNDDFDGSLHDIDAPKEERDGESSEDEEGDDDRIDQQMGDLGENEEVVDEKLWGDDEDDKKDPKDKKEEKYKEDAPIQVDDKNDLDYGAGEEQDDEKDEQGGDKPKPEKPKGKDAKEEEQTKMDLDGEDEGGVNDDFDDKYEDNEFTKPEAPEEELELPDDMNLDGARDDDDEGGNQEEAGPEADAEGGKEAEGEDEKEGGDDEKDGEGPPEDVEGKVGDDGEDGEDKPGDRGDVEMPEGEEPEANDDAGMGQEAADQEDGGEKDEGADKEEDPPAPAHGRGEEEDAPTPAEQQQAGPEGVESAAPIAASTGEARGKQQEEPEEPVGMEDQQAPQAGNTAEDDDTAPDTAPQARQGNVGQSSAAPKGGAAPLKGGDKQQPPQPKDKNSRGKQQRQEPNPLRNLGDAMERWKADLAVNHEAPQDKKEEEEEGAAHDEDAAEDAGPTSAVEHQFLGANEQRLEGDTQALAPATEDQAQKLEGEQDAREEEEAGAEVVDAMDEDEVDPGGGDDEPEPGKQPLAGVAPKQWAGAQKNAKLAADKEEEEEEEVGGEGAGDDADALAALDLGGHGGEPDGLEDGIFSSVVAKFGEEKQPGEQEQARDVVSTTGLSEERADALRQQLDERLRAPVAEDPSGSERYGAELWSRCEALTAGLSSELTEQLRLILEPTLASKLAGDYRTGKRINMKKVIAYIASHFRKDKIWMRRTRPDKRRYQVMLAIDDSRSMAENSCGGVALEALTLICKSMSRLEVGQVGVIKFGGSDGVVPLQSLDTPFSDAVGPKLVGSLRFAQDNTLADQPMLDLMTSLTHMLDVARHQGGAGGIGVGTQDLHQLVLVLADGRFHEKESLHAVVREMAAKQGVCLVFIVLDNPQNSLSDMQSVSFLNNKPVFSKYLDSFPFPFYILLRDISALPRTLAELLRQWFELSAH